MKTEYTQKLAELIKAAGQELIDRAADLAGEGDLVSSFAIWIRFPQDGMPVTIEAQREHIARRCAELTYQSSKSCGDA